MKKTLCLLSVWIAFTTLIVSCCGTCEKDEKKQARNDSILRADSINVVLNREKAKQDSIAGSESNSSDTKKSSDKKSSKKKNSTSSNSNVSNSPDTPEETLTLSSGKYFSHGKKAIVQSLNGSTNITFRTAFGENLVYSLVSGSASGSTAKFKLNDKSRNYETLTVQLLSASSFKITASTFEWSADCPYTLNTLYNFSK